MEIEPNRIEIASDVNTRDGIGIEVYKDNILILEIFREDSDNSSIITLWNKEISLADMEYYITFFKEKIL